MKTLAGHLKAQEAADRLGMHYQTLMKWIWAGKVKGAVKRGKTWEIPLKEVERIENGL